MSQLAMTFGERTEAVQQFGYTEREAAFLCLAALHGGYFLLRQYCRFLGKEIGGTAAALVQKTLAKKHAKVSTYCNQTNIYHLCNRSFYAAIGQPDNRNRRHRAPLTIKNRLMGLDFVLAHREHRYLATEQEKLAYFTDTLGLDRSALPAKHYQAAGGKMGTARYFVDKYPLFLAEASPAAPVVSFCYVDEGVVTLSHFDTYLHDYSRLFACLPRFQVVYVAALSVFFQSAQRTFQQLIQRLSSSGGAAPLDPVIQRKLDHFASRSLYENKQFASFDRAKLIRLREDRQEFSGDMDEALYDRWKVGGDRAVLTILTPQQTVPARIEATFSTCLLEHRYDVFGSLTAF